MELPGLAPSAVAARAMAAMAIGPRQLADPVAAEVDDQSVMVQPYRDLVADQAGRHGVDHPLCINELLPVFIDAW
jgi:hypothetical protein